VHNRQSPRQFRQAGTGHAGYASRWRNEMNGKCHSRTQAIRCIANATKQRKENAMKNIIFIGVCILLVIGFCGCGSQSPEKAYKNIATDAAAGNWDNVYDAFSAKSQGQLDMSLKMMVGLAAAFSEEDENVAEHIENLSGKELFVAMLSGEESDANFFSLGDIIDSKVDGERATLRVRDGDDEEEVQMVKENGVWKLHFEID